MCICIHVTHNNSFQLFVSFWFKWLINLWIIAVCVNVLPQPACAVKQNTFEPVSWCVTSRTTWSIILRCSMLAESYNSLYKIEIIQNIYFWHCRRSWQTKTLTGQTMHIQNFFNFKQSSIEFNFFAIISIYR